MSLVELMFLETSALTGENVEESFLKCARSILSKIDSGILYRSPRPDLTYMYPLKANWIPREWVPAFNTETTR